MTYLWNTVLHPLNKKEESQNCPSFAKVQIKNDKKGY